MTLPPRIGRYRILELLGQGAMGVVYRGRDEGLERDVAVKVVRGEFLDDDSRAQFQKEARAAARLQHPHIVTVYELGEQDGAPFMAMELLEGLDLQRAMRAGGLSEPSRALAVIEQVLAGLGHAHARGIVHRDLKPSNVFLLAGSHAKILDFGVARLGEGLTVTGRVVGTPHYMSPEQIRADPVDGRSDLFSTALIFYEMVTGAKAYRPGSAVTIMYQIVHEDADLSRLPATAGGAALMQVLRRALARDRNDRYPDAASLAAALSEAVRAHAADPVAPEPAFENATVLSAASPDLDLPLTVASHEEPGVVYPPPAPARSRAWVPAALVSVVVTAGGVWWWLTHARPPAPVTIEGPIEPLPALPSPGESPTIAPTVAPTIAPVPEPSGEAVPPSSAAAVPTSVATTSTQIAQPVVTPPPTHPAPTAVPRATFEPRPPSPTGAKAGDVASRLDRADQLFQAGRLRAAQAEVRAVLRDDPGNAEARYLADDIELDLTVEDHLQKARAALARGDREAARQQAEAGLRLKPNESRLTALLRRLEQP